MALTLHPSPARAFPPGLVDEGEWEEDEEEDGGRGEDAMAARVFGAVIAEVGVG